MKASLDSRTSDELQSTANTANTAAIHQQRLTSMIRLPLSPELQTLFMQVDGVVPARIPIADAGRGERFDLADFNLLTAEDAFASIPLEAWMPFHAAPEGGPGCVLVNVTLTVAARKVVNEVTTRLFGASRVSAPRAARQRLVASVVAWHVTSVLRREVAT